MEKYGYVFKTCIICGKEGIARGFYYPTYFNGDAEWLGDFCTDHKRISLKDIKEGKTKLLYKTTD